jgi:hypothetical protein
VQVGEDLDAGPLQFGPLGRRGLVQPAAEDVGRVVQRHPAVHLVHHEERGAQRLAVRLFPAQPGQRDAAARSDLRDQLELAGDVVAGEDGDRTQFRRHPRDVGTALAGARAGPFDLEQQRGARQPAAGRHAHAADHRRPGRGQLPGQPAL